MNVTELDHIPESDVPLWCLQYADWLSDRGVPDAGWRALGVLTKQPIESRDYEQRWMWTGRGENDGEVNRPVMWSRTARLHHNWLFAVTRTVKHALGERPRNHGFMWDFSCWDDSRSSAMQAAADAFLTLDEGTRREILGNVLGSVP